MNVSGVAAATSTPSLSGQPTDAMATAAGDFETFLKLLTTQMKNQDPLNPLDSTEFVAQLANFSAVEQQVNTNKALDAILAELSVGAQVGAADWIGKEVRAAAPVNWTGTPTEVLFDRHAQADRVELVVRNAEETVVSRQIVTQPGDSLIWGGETAAGARLPHGTYSLSFESYAGDELLNASQGRVFARVKDVSIDNGRVTFGLEGGGTIAQADVTQIR